MRGVVGRAKTIGTQLLRRGPRQVLMTPPGTNGGNHMYLWTRAAVLREDVPTTYVQYRESQQAWLAEMPALQALCAARLGVTDRRLVRLGNVFGQSFTREQLDRFCHDYLLTSSRFSARIERMRGQVPAGTVTINVRRGDYYGTSHEAEFGMRIVPYVLAAVAYHARRGRVDRVQVVSDDLAWCEAELSSPLAAAGAQAVRFTRPGEDMFDDLAALAVSRRLVLANSTFSYWGAYLAGTLGTSPADVVAPFFHQRSTIDHKPSFHDPQWQVVTEIPGGWPSGNPLTQDRDTTSGAH